MSAKDAMSSVMTTMQGKVDGFAAGVDKAFKSMQANWLKAVAILYSLKKAFNFAEEGAKFQQMQQGFANVAASHGESANEIIRGLRRVSAGTVSTAEMMKQAGTAMILGIPADKLNRMMEISRASARVMGKDTTEMFEKLTIGLARQSKLRLDDLGILIDVKKANQEYAATMGITGRELTDTEKKQAFLNSAMASGEDIIRRVNVQALSAAEGFAIFKSKLEGIKIWTGKALVAVTSFGFGVTQLAAASFANAIGMIAEFLSKIIAVGKVLPFIGDKFQGASDALKEFAEFEFSVKEEAFKLADGAFKVAASMGEEAKAIEGLNPIMKNLGDETDKVTKAKIDYESKILAVVLATERLAAGKERLIEIDIREFALTGATTDQVERYTAARQRQLEVENQFALIKEREKILAAESPGVVGGDSEFGGEALAMQTRFDALVAFHDRRIQFLTDIGAAEIDIRAAVNQAQIELDEQTAQTRMAIASGMAGALASIAESIYVMTGSKSKKMLKVVKATAIAQAVISGYWSAIEAWRSGMQTAGPWAPVVAAAYTAASLAKTGALISKIGGSQGGDVGNTGTATSPSIGRTPEILTPASEQTQPTQNLTIKVYALDGADLNWAKIAEENIKPALEGLKDRNIVLDIAVAEA